MDNNIESRDNIEDKIKKALKTLVEQDSELLKININERTICHRLAIYLEEVFEDYNVDCEYNRDGPEVPKRLTYDIEEIYKKHGQLGKYDIKDTDAKTVYPDIIVHKRKEKNNLIVIEAKKDNSKTSKEIDMEKLRKYKKELGYKFAIFLLIKVEKTFDNWYEYFEYEFI